MNKAKLMAFVKNDTMKALVCSSEVKTEEDIKSLNRKGYNIGFVSDELKKMFPSIDTNKIFYNNGYDKVFYYDKEKLIIFPIQLVGKTSIYPLDELMLKTMERAIMFEREAKEGKYDHILISLQDRMRMELLEKLISENKIPDPYTLFITFYVTADYGCSALSKETLRKLADSKSEADKRNTAASMSELPQTITVYRGEGDESAVWRESFSWTTDINIANFFATRLESKKAAIHIAEVDKSDVIEYFESEKECIILPEKLRYKNCIDVYGIDLLEKQLPDISEQYQRYRDFAIDCPKFNIDDSEHGILHSCRVAMHCLILANMKKLTREETDILCTAAVFHDARRLSNGDEIEHGAASAKYYSRYANAHPEQIKYNMLTEQIIKYHSLPDDEGRNAIGENNWYLLDIFKDADALDRVRFGIRDLDLNQLRTSEAKSMTMVANMLFQELKLPEPELSQDLKLT
ncbi:MAG: HD domain-containing protein [Clostridia bacterium]|nr:HD domain-containing protein [Clostridia bacterium]